jgi:uncharacterized ion transporter superfamily protein YfcC
VQLRVPHPFQLLLGGVLVAAVLTWVLPAGTYERRADPTLGRDVVVPGSYTSIASEPVGPMAALMAIPRGIVSGGDVVVTILFVGGAFVLLDHTGALGRIIGALIGRARRPRATVVIVSVVFATFGALENMHEELIALMPMLVVLSRGLGFGAVTALAMSLGAACVGAAFGPTNPFGAGLALKFAELPPTSAFGLRIILLVAAVSIWIAWTLARASHDDVRPEVQAQDVSPPTVRDGWAVAFVTLPFFVYVWGVLTKGWEFHELSALFLMAGFGVGLVQRLSLRETTTEFLRGMDAMLAAALFVGVARAISVVLHDGRVMDTIVAGLVSPLDAVPPLVAATLMIPIQALLHIPVASNSAQAVLTMPIMAPTADLLGFTRDAAVLAYQGGGVMMDLVSPTNGAMLAMLLKAGVPYGRWLRFAVPGMALLWGVTVIGLVLLR